MSDKERLEEELGLFSLERELLRGGAEVMITVYKYMNGSNKEDGDTKEFQLPSSAATITDFVNHGWLLQSLTTYY